MADYSISELIKIVEADTIFIPKSVALRNDVYDASKTLFGVVFTDCVEISKHTEVLSTEKLSES